MTRKNFFNLFIFLFSFHPFVLVNSELRIEITQGLDKAVKIAVVPFAWKGKRNSPANLDQIIANDLRISGRFEPLKKENMFQTNVSRRVGTESPQIKSSITINPKAVRRVETESLQGNEGLLFQFCF